MTLNDFFNIDINAEYLNVHGYNTEEDEGIVRLEYRVIRDLFHDLCGGELYVSAGLKRNEKNGLLTEDDRKKIIKWLDYRVIEADFETHEIMVAKLEETK